VRLQFAYFYWMKEGPSRVRVVAPRHVAHWRELRLAGYLGGPFQDRTGGLIVFEAGDATEAERAVRADPFVREGLLAAYWLKAWAPERG
jgi:uncharacterized protein YciI